MAQDSKGRANPWPAMPKTHGPTAVTGHKPNRKRNKVFSALRKVFSKRKPLSSENFTVQYGLPDTRHDFADEKPLRNDSSFQIQQSPLHESVPRKLNVKFLDESYVATAQAEQRRAYAMYLTHLERKMATLSQPTRQVKDSRLHRNGKELVANAADRSFVRSSNSSLRNGSYFQRVPSFGSVATIESRNYSFLSSRSSSIRSLQSGSLINEKIIRSMASLENIPRFSTRKKHEYDYDQTFL